MTATEVRNLLDYDPATGKFIWLISPSIGTRAGDFAGTIYANGRRYITIRGQRYFAAHLAWLYFHGSWPDGQIDHENLNRADDRIANLRIATRQQNSANRRASNSIGLKGVILCHGRRWRARIRVNGRLIHLGYFQTKETAHAAYAKAAREHFGEFARP